MFPRHPALLLVVVFSLSLLPCAAQNGGEVTLRFLSFPKAPDLKPVELLVGDNKTIKVEIPTNELSPRYKVPQLASWSVGETVAGPDGKNVFKEFGRAKALTSSSQLILLVRKGKEYADGFDVMPIDDLGTNFSGGKFLFFNAARIDIACEVGGEKFVIKPNQHAIIKPKAQPGERSFQAVFWFRKDDDAKAFFSSRWPFSDDARSLVFFYHEPGTNFLRFHTIRDFPNL
jgi:hypothetical protein